MIFLSRYVCCGKSGQIKFFFFSSGIAACIGCFTREFHRHPTVCLFFIVRQTSRSLSWSPSLKFLTYLWLRFTANSPPEEPVTQVSFFSARKGRIPGKMLCITTKKVDKRVASGVTSKGWQLVPRKLFFPRLTVREQKKV